MLPAFTTMFDAEVWRCFQTSGDQGTATRVKHGLHSPAYGYDHWRIRSLLSYHGGGTHTSMSFTFIWLKSRFSSQTKIPAGRSKHSNCSAAVYCVR